MAFTVQRKEDIQRSRVDENGQFIKTYQLAFLVTSDSNTENTTDEALAAVGALPGSPHPDWSGATTSEFSCVRKLTKPPHQAWDVTISYSTTGVVPEDPGGGVTTDPVDRRVKRRTGTTQQQRFIIKDRNGEVITDAAGSAYDGGVPVTDYLGTFIFERNEAHTSSSMYQAVFYSGKINSATFMTAAAGTLMLDVVGEECYEGDYHFWKFTYTMTYDKEGWQPQPLNAGLYEYTGGERRRIIEADGTPTTEPQPLTALGLVIPVADRATDSNYRNVDHYPSFDFSTLGLPTS